MLNSDNVNYLIKETDDPKAIGTHITCVYDIYWCIHKPNPELSYSIVLQRIPKNFSDNIGYEGCAGPMWLVTYVDCGKSCVFMGNTLLHWQQVAEALGIEDDKIDASEITKVIGPIMECTITVCTNENGEYEKTWYKKIEDKEGGVRW